MHILQQRAMLADPDATLAETLSVLQLRRLLSRRRMIKHLGLAAGLISPLKALACAVIPSETGGPYPGDGTNGPNALTQSGIVRSDIRASFGSAGSSVAAGTPITVTLRLVNTSDSCAPLAGHAIYLWHCNASGEYSMYGAGITNQNYLRGVQVTDGAGQVTFTSIYPACYSGRWPHIHFEVYGSAAQAVSGTNALKTSQLALPESTSREVYAQTALYPSSIARLNQTSLRSDMVFSDDGAILQTPTVSGSTSGGYTMSLEVGIAAGATTAAPDIDQQGLTGVWYEPSSSGQGLALEVYPDLHGSGRGYLQGGWFTFDVAPAGGVEKQRWYTFGGEVLAGGSTATLPLYANTGGNFNAAPVTSGRAVGSVSLSFGSCTAGQFNYAFTDGSGRSGTIPMTRLAPNMTCSATASRPTNADFALSGNWYDPATSGQGFIVEINPNAPVVYFAWYTYAVNGQSLSGSTGQRWFTGQGNYSAGSRSNVVTLYETVGGVFDANTPATQSGTAVGTATLTFDSCSNASLSFAFTGGSNTGHTGTIRLSRVGAVPAGCAADLA